jgi:hypothetical protein
MTTGMRTKKDPSQKVEILYIINFGPFFDKTKKITG